MSERGTKQAMGKDRLGKETMDWHREYLALLRSFDPSPEEREKQFAKDLAELDASIEIMCRELDQVLQTKTSPRSLILCAERQKAGKRE